VNERTNDVLNAIFGNCRRTKLALFFKTDVMITFCVNYHHSSIYLLKKCQFLGQLVGDKIINIIILVPGQFSVVGNWSTTVGDGPVLQLDETSFAEPPVALKHNKQILRVQTVTVRVLVLVKVSGFNASLN
jgi:hypothetical protein